ncbi:MAG: hypothetical protein RL477_1216, partial [Pseudomonadota bacterium]
DITGQRITRIVRALKDIESKVSAIVTTFSGVPGAVSKVEKPAPAPSSANGKPSDKELLNGPQLPTAAQSQEDIDALFNSLK